MIKSKFKRVTSLFLATLMCVTTFAGIGSTTAYAASGEKADVYMVDFPRDGDANYDGVWGHSNLTLKNGWHTGRSNFTNLKAIGSYSGNVAYCIEPGISLKVGQTMNKYDENYFNNLASNGVISGDEIRLFVGRILQYGYRGTISTSWRSQNEAAANSIAQAYATQLLIWETVIGERDVNFNHVSASGCSNVKDVINARHPLRNKIFSYYNSMVQSVQNHATIPSFCNKSSGSAKTIELEWNGSKYTTTLTDSNNVLSKYNFKASISGVNFSVNGNKLTVSMDTAPSKEFTITATKKNAVRRGVVVWSEGKHGQNSSVQDVVSYAQEVSDSINGYVKMKVSYGSCQIVKTSEDGKVDGINFTITGNGINQTVTTANGGKFQIDNLMPGIYTVTEQAYDKYEPQETHRVTVVAGQIAKVTFNNKLKRGDLQVVKSSEDNLVEGVKFHLFGTSLSGDAVDQYAVTDKNGVATFKDVLISGSEPYTLEEVDTAIRYVVPKNQTVPVKWKEVTTRNFNNILKKFTVTVTKSDAEKGEAQGNAKLSGAVYGIYKGETLVDKYVTDENGQFTTKEYVCDTDWTIREITPSEGYLLDKTIHEVGADPKLYEVEHNLTSNDVTEQVIKGNVAIIKHTDDGETKIETPEKGASFEIYLKSAGSYDAANKDERDTIVCDENGFGQTKDMPYGIYTVHQTSGWEGREMMDDFDVFISQNAQTYRYLINNRNFESFVNVVKVDAESGKSIPYAGAGFKIYDPQGNQVKMTFTYPTPTTIDVFYTDANGSLVTPEKLDYGKGYSIVEVQAPYGYVLDDTPVYFDITEENSTEEGGVTVVKVNKPNMAQKGTITVEKTGEVFSGVNVSGSEDSDVIYQPVYEVAGLEGAVYEVRAAEDISTPDGTLRYSKGEVVDTITTSSDGFVKSKELYLGKYEVKEITAPYGMVVSGETHTVELTYAGQNISVTETSTSFYNERQKVQVSLAKAIEKDETFGIGDNGEIKNISFGLYAAEDIVSASGTVIPADGLIEIVSVNENGTAVMKSDLPFGKYYVKEIATDEHYILSDTKYPVVFEYAGQDTATVEIKVNDGKEMGFKEGNLLEPSCGIGNFIGMLPDSMQDSKIYGVELDTISAGIAQQLYQKTTIAAQGFEETNLPDSFFDGVVGNVPFGDFKVSDKRYDKHKFLIHDYFFAKSLDKLRPGGVMAFVTSKGTMDKETLAVRKYIAQRAELLGAIRLPNNTFKGNAGTEVVSDILILQKRDRLIDIEPDWVHLDTDENGIKMNSYFVQHPEMILGEMKMVSGRFGMEATCVPYENADLAAQLDEAVANIHGEITEYETEEELEEEDNSIPADPTVRNFSYTVVGDKIYYRENSRMTPVEVSATAENRIKGMIAIRNSVRTLIELQTEDYPDSEIKAEQERLNRLYDTFSGKYGLINSRANTSAFSQDSSFSLLSALEIIGEDGELERKADMFSKRTIKPHTPVTSVDTASEALAVSLGEKATIDMDYMMELSGKSENEIFEDLKGVIFLNPLYEYGNSYEPKYLMADEYLSGNVREKLRIAKNSAELYPEDYKVNVEALQKVQPKDLTASEISVRLGATWLPPDDVQEFIFHLLETPRYAQWNIKVHFSPFTSEWNIEGKCC